MSTANYITEAKKGDRKPVTLIGIEAPDAQAIVLTTQSDWEGGTVDDELDTATVPGDVTLDGPVNTWSSLANFPGNRMLHSLVYYNGKFYLFGGAPTYNTTTNTLYEYDISLNTWTAKTSAPVNRAGHTAVVYNGKMYIHGGFAAWGGASTNTLYECDLTTFVWTAKTSGGATYTWNATASVYSGKMYVFGGSVLPFGPHRSTLYECDLTTFVWTAKTSYSQAVGGGSMGSCVIEDNIYIGCCFTTNPAAPAVGRNYHIARYDLINDSWVNFVIYPVQNTITNCFEPVGEKIIIHTTYISGNAYELFVGDKSFHDLTNLNVFSNRYMAKSTSNDGVVYVGGGQTSSYVQLNSFIDIRRGYTATGNMETSVIDMGIVPTANTSFYVDDTIPADTTVSYTAEGSTTGVFAGEEVSLGSISDGASLSPYQYYKVGAVFSTTEQTRTPTLKSFSFYAGATEFIYYSTDNDNPVRGAKPYVAPGSLTASNSQIALLEKPRTGEVSAKLFWTEDTGNLIATGNLKNKAVLVKSGFDGMIEADFVPFFTGTWHDFIADPINMEFTIKCRDIFKQFQKIKYPLETVDGTDTKTTVPVTWTNANVIQVIQDILTALNVADRYIDTTELNSLKAGARSGVNWQITRTLSKPEPVLDLLNELSVIAGLFLVPMPTGELSPKIYDPTASAVATLDANNYIFSALNGGQASLYTRQLVYHTPTSGHPGQSEGDYSKAFIKINATQETAWDEKSQRNWYEKWNATDFAIQALADRMDVWFSEPKIMTRVNEVPARFIDVNPGDIVEIDNLRIPVVGASWPGYSSAKKFLVLGKRVNPKTTTINFDLLEV